MLSETWLVGMDSPANRKGVCNPLPNTTGWDAAPAMGDDVCAIRPTGNNIAEMAKGMSLFKLPLQRTTIISPLLNSTSGFTWQSLSKSTNELVAPPVSCDNFVSQPPGLSEYLPWDSLGFEPPFPYRQPPLVLPRGW